MGFGGREILTWKNLAQMLADVTMCFIIAPSVSGPFRSIGKPELSIVFPFSVPCCSIVTRQECVVVFTCLGYFFLSLRSFVSVRKTRSAK